MSARLCNGGLGVLSDQHDQDQGTKMPEPGQDQAKVVAGRRQDQVDRVAVFAGEVISLQQAVALEMPDHRLDGAASSELALDCGRRQVALARDVDLGVSGLGVVAAIDLPPEEWTPGYADFASA
jgi:hypothetical protein